MKINDFIITSKDQSKQFKSKNEVFIFNKLDKFFKNFISNKVDIKKTAFISLGSRFIFKKKDIDFFNNNLLNFHCSRLPYDSGGGGFSWQIMRNDRINNQLVHLVEPKIDSGKVLMYENSIFPSHCKIPIDFENYHNSKFVLFYAKFIKKLKEGKSFELQNQPDYLGRYNSRLNTNVSGWINWNTSSENLYRFINAFDDPYSGARTYYKNKIVIIKKVHLHAGESSNHPFMTGLISRHDRKWLVVSTTDKNMLLIENVIDKNSKNIIKDLRVGNRFYTPLEKLDLAFRTKVSYSTSGLKKLIFK